MQMNVVFFFLLDTLMKRFNVRTGTYIHFFQNTVTYGNKYMENKSCNFQLKAKIIINIMLNCQLDRQRSSIFYKLMFKSLWTFSRLYNSKLTSLRIHEFKDSSTGVARKMGILTLLEHLIQLPFDKGVHGFQFFFLLFPFNLLV